VPTHQTLAIAGSLLTLVALAAVLCFEGREGARRRGLYVAKPLASTGFLLTAAANGALDNSYGVAVFVALMFSFWGDVFLMSKAVHWFRAGLFAFLLGHVAFAVAFARSGQDAAYLGAALLVFVPVVALVARWLLPHVKGGMRGPVVAYILVMSSMVVLAVAAFGAGSLWFVPAGAVAFYLSDLSVARERFVSSSRVNRLWGLPLYYLAQHLFAWGLAG